MNLEVSRLPFDFGLVVLIWIVQLVIYPSFRHYKKENLLIWHKKYAFAISVVVIPLMFGQLGIVLAQFFKEINSYTVVSLVLIVAVWLVTFSQFVPIHKTISKGESNENLLMRLVKYNWVRTALWNLLFLWSILFILF